MIHIHLINTIIRRITSLSYSTTLLSSLSICGLFSSPVNLRYRVIENHNRRLGSMILCIFRVYHWFHCDKPNLVPLCFITLIIVNTIEVYLLPIFVTGTYILNYYYRWILSHHFVVKSRIVASMRNLVKIVLRRLLSSWIEQQFLLLQQCLRLTVVIVKNWIVSSISCCIVHAQIFVVVVNFWFIIISIVAFIIVKLFLDRIRLRNLS